MTEEIAGKTHSEILLMKKSTRCWWYKKISLEEKKEAMRIVDIVGRIKLSENNPMKRPEVKAKLRALFINKPLSEETKVKLSEAWTPERKDKHGKRMIENWKDKEYRNNLSGENSFLWIDGRSAEPYGIEFNNELKEQIRGRDNHICQECHQIEEQLGHTLNVHHIDYDKKNNKSENLISLCKSCHSKTNRDREYWIGYFREMIRKVFGDYDGERITFKRESGKCN